MNFALTKIQPPRPRADTIERPLLERRLGAALAEAPVVLLCAPAGFGKTTALTRQLARLAPGVAPAWISADEDDDLGRLAACLVAALEPFDPPWRMSPAALVAALDGTRAPLEALRVELLNTLAATDVARGLVVIDDVHRIADPAVFTFLDGLAERLPPSWGLVLLGRMDPPLALPRLRAGDRLAEFRQPDLQLSLPEVQAMVQALGQGQGAGDAPALAELLYERTHGWAAGLRLSLSGRWPGGTGLSQRHLFDYLATEVLDGMAPALRQFLLRCSVLPVLSAPECAAVSGDARAAHWIDQLERQGLFVSTLDGDAQVLRLHDLFRDFLEDRLRAEQPDEVPALLSRAAAVEADPVRRIGLLLRAGDTAAAERALLQAAPALLLGGGLGQVLRLAEQFPPALQALSPALALVRGLCAWPRFEWSTMQVAMAHAGDGFEAMGHAELAQQARALESLALTALNRLDEAAQRLRQVRAQPMGRDTAALSELMDYWHSGARGPAEAPAAHLTRMVALLSDASPEGWYRSVPHFLFIGRPGMRAAMEGFVRGALAAAGDAHAPLRASALALQAWLLLWQGRVGAAAERLREAQDDDRWLGQPRNLRISVLACQAALSAACGERERFRAAARAMLADVDGNRERRSTWRGVYLYQSGRLAAGLGDWAFAEEMRQALDSMPTAHEWPFMAPVRAALAARGCLHEGDAEAACALLEPWVERIAPIDMISAEPELRAVLAAAHLAQGRTERAWSVLAPALQQALASGEPMPLQLVGPQLLGRLAGTRWGAGAPAEQRELVVRLHAAAGAPADPPAAGGAPRAAAPAPDALTAREREILGRIAAGDSNKLIARAFELSPHTVKRHVANILGKLALQSRGQAAAWWHERA